jgi:hypothetical protein
VLKAVFKWNYAEADATWQKWIKTRP